MKETELHDARILISGPDRPRLGVIRTPEGGLRIHTDIHNVFVSVDLSPDEAAELGRFIHAYCGEHATIHARSPAKARFSAD